MKRIKMILTEEETEELKGFMKNPFYREVVKNAPDEACRNYIVHGLIYGFYARYDPVECRESLEEGLTAEDWRYIRKNLAGNDPFFLKCLTRIRELEKEE